MTDRPSFVPATEPVLRHGVGRLLIVVAAIGLYLALVMPVFAQEAYYWSYAQHPDLSYFDHPPMVAWLIWLGTTVFGHGVLGLRIGTVACGTGATILGLLLARRMGADRFAQRAWVVLGVAVPLYVFIHFFANPDPPLVFGWSLALYALWRVRETGANAWWIVAGAGSGFGLLSKYTAAFLAVGGLLLLVFDPAFRRQLRRPGPYLGVLTAAVVFLPVIIWNVGNGFESFRFQTEGRWGKSDLGTRWLGQFVVTQLGGYHPVLLFAAFPVVAWLWRRMWKGDPRAGFLLAFGVPMPLFFLANSLFIQVKMNWLLPTYLPLLLGTLLWWRESGVIERRPRLANAGRCAVAWTPFLIVIAPLVHVVPQGGGSSWTGWDRLGKSAMAWKKQVDAEDGIAGNMFFFCSGYRDSAQLSRNVFLEHRSSGDLGPLEPTLAQNVLGASALQFDHWATPRDHIGQDAIYVLPRADARPREIEKIARHFRAVERKERIELRTWGVRQMYADVYVCREYLGPDVAGSGGDDADSDR